MWEHFHHQADIGVRGIGKSMAQAFEEAGVALMAVMCQPDTVEAKNEIQIECEAADVELLFVDWLSAIIYETATRGMLFGRFEAQIDGNKLSGKAWGEKIDAEKHKTIVEVKGATYAELKVACNEDGRWIAQCVVDV
jgi:tRNA nucleotidyltransferase (CCA-adding enzyme)